MELVRSPLDLRHLFVRDLPTRRGADRGGGVVGPAPIPLDRIVGGAVARPVAATAIALLWNSRAKRGKAP